MQKHVTHSKHTHTHTQHTHTHTHSTHTHTHTHTIHPSMLCFHFPVVQATSRKNIFTGVVGENVGGITPSTLNTWLGE